MIVLSPILQLQILELDEGSLISKAISCVISIPDVDRKFKQKVKNVVEKIANHCCWYSQKNCLWNYASFIGYVTALHTAQQKIYTQ